DVPFFVQLRVPSRMTPDSPQARRAALYAVPARVPAGRVVTDGHLAPPAGLGRVRRWLRRRPAQLPDASRLAWPRVLAAGGRLSLPAGSPAGDEQRARLRSEGLLLDGDRVDLRRHGWHPEENYG